MMEIVSAGGAPASGKDFFVAVSSEQQNPRNANFRTVTILWSTASAERTPVGHFADRAPPERFASVNAVVLAADHDAIGTGWPPRTPG